MKVKEIIKKYLEDNGYSGLYLDSECGCRISDLVCCDEDCTNCEPGYIDYKSGVEGGWDYVVGPEKPQG